MTRKDDNGDQSSGGEATWTNTGATRYGRGQHNAINVDILSTLFLITNYDLMCRAYILYSSPIGY